MPSINVAVAGTGLIGPVHVEGLKRAGQNVLGILGSSPEKSQAAAERLGLARAYKNYEELLADDKVGAVHIATPNRLHFDMASRALAAGKHVMCEKPLAMTARESADLVRLAEAANLATAVTYNLRFYPLCHEAAARIKTGDLGDVWHVTGSYAQDWLFHATDFNWRVLAQEQGESKAVADIGTHWLDLVQFITGLRIEAVCADLKTIHPVRQRPMGSVETFSSASDTVETKPIEVSLDDYGCVMLHFEGGARGVVWVSQVAAGRKNCVRLEISGSNATLAFDSESPNLMWIGHRDRSNESLIRDPALMSASASEYADYPGGHAEGYPDTFKQLFRAFYNYIEAGDLTAKPPFPTFADGHHEIVLVDAILKSHRERRWVKIERT